MVRIRRLTMAALVLAAGLFVPSTAGAGPLLDWLCPDKAPTPSYSPFRYWAPGAARVYDDIHGPKLSVYAPDRHPEIPPTYIILRYCHPAVPAAATLIEPPSAPAESRFQY